MSRFARPTPVTDADIAFSVAGGRGDRLNLMPAYAEIPAEFKTPDSTWVKFQKAWFYSGVGYAAIVAKHGIDKDVALRHLMAIQKSWEPKHEHKEAAVAYLASLWLESWQ